MYTPLLAAGMAAALISTAPLASDTFKSAIGTANVFAPLTCAMAHSGSCSIATAHGPAGASAEAASETGARVLVVSYAG